MALRVAGHLEPDVATTIPVVAPTSLSPHSSRVYVGAERQGASFTEDAV